MTRSSTLVRVATRSLIAALSVGCIHPFLPDMRTPADRAREIEPKCAGMSPQAAAPLLDPRTIDSVEPTYSYVKSGPNDREARLRGALLHLRPLPGMTHELIARALECHEARVTLGQEPAAADDDPYVLSDRWIEIDVDSEGDGFAVKAQVDEFEDAKRILERARRFVHVR